MLIKNAILAAGLLGGRDAALEALEKWAAEISLEPLLPLFPNAMMMESPAGRSKLLCWLAEEMLGTKPSSSRQHKEVMHKMIFQQHKES